MLALQGKRQSGKDTATDIRKQSFTDSARIVDGKATKMFPGMVGRLQYAM